MTQLTHFLLVYRRSTAKLVECKDLGPDREKALWTRFQRELKEKDDPDTEVVLLTASSRAALERTHARYFRNEMQLRADLLTTTSSSGTEDTLTPYLPVTDKK